MEIDTSKRLTFKLETVNRKMVAAMENGDIKEYVRLKYIAIPSLELHIHMLNYPMEESLCELNLKQLEKLLLNTQNRIQKREIFIQEVDSMNHANILNSLLLELRSSLLWDKSIESHIQEMIKHIKTDANKE